MLPNLRRSLGPLVKKVRPTELVGLADKICDNMMAKDDQLREHSGLGMKTLLSGLSSGKASAAGPMVVQQIGPKLLDGVVTDASGRDIQNTLQCRVISSGQ